MKNFWGLFLTLLIPTSAFALPVGNPWDASLLFDSIFLSDYVPCTGWIDTLSLRVGFYGDYVFDRRLRIDTEENRSTIKRSEIYTNAGYLALNFCDRVDLFGTLGASGICLRGHTKEFAPIIARDTCYTLSTETAFSWSAGLRGMIWECGYFGVGGETQYFFTRPQISSLQEDGFPNFYGQSGEVVEYREWQIALGASYAYHIAPCMLFVPYIAAKWSRVWQDNSHFPVFVGDEEEELENGVEAYTALNLKNIHDWGCVIGVTLIGSNKVSVSVEGRFIDEKAVHINSQFRF